MSTKEKIITHWTRFQHEQVLLRNNDQRFLAFVLICVAAWVAVAMLFDTTEEEQSVPRRSVPVFRVDLNTAEKEELLLLPGIGETLAARIIEHRTQNGPFTFPQDIQNVKGIGPKKHEKITPMIEILRHEAGGMRHETEKLPLR